MRRRQGFTLIELIASIVLAGVIAVFGSYFLATGVKGELTARQAATKGQKAEAALERIALELRDANGGPGAGGAMAVRASPARIRYNSSLAALGSGREINFDSANSRITLTPGSGATVRTLIDGVSACSVSFAGTGAASTVTVNFTLSGGAAQYSITIKPRGNTVTPVNG